MTLRSDSRIWEICTSDHGKYVRNRASREYTIWHHMCLRCYDESEQAKQPAYIGCTMSDNFKDFQWFAEWCNNQIGWGVPGYELDKDILSNGEKRYSEQNCVFVPRRLNTLLINCVNGEKRDLPRGVYLDYRNSRTRYLALCRDADSKKINLGRYDTIAEADAAYVEYKSILCKKLAAEYFGKVDPRVLHALNNYGRLDDHSSN